MVEIVTWPDSQMVTEYDGCFENAALINSEAGLDAFGGSAYVVDSKWWKDCLDGKIPTCNDDSGYEPETDFMIDWDFDPDTFDAENYEWPTC